MANEDDDIDDDKIDSSELALGDTILYSDENMDKSENAILSSEQKEETPHYRTLNYPWISSLKM